MRSHHRGFTLVEMAIVLAIVSLVTGFSLVLASVYKERESYHTAEERLQRVGEAIITFYRLHGRIPCPARRDLSPGDADYGLEFDCNSTPPSPTAVITANNTRIGNIPVRTLNLPSHYAIDSWDSKMLYAMTRDLGVQSSFASTDGAIEILDGFGMNLTSPASTAAFILVSHGKDRKGALPQNGATPIIACSGSGNDVENCNNDDIFEDARVAHSSDPLSAEHFDDRVLWSTKDFVGMPISIDPKIGAISANKLCMGDNTGAQISCSGSHTANDGANNVFIGALAGTSLSSGTANVALGAGALANLSTGQSNTGVGRSALATVSTTDNNVAIGSGADILDSSIKNAIALGANAVVGMDNSIAIGNMSGNSWATLTAGGVWAFPSDQQLKKEITLLPYGLKELLQLRPVSYFSVVNDSGKRHMGLIAQEVQPIIPELVQPFKAQSGVEYLSIEYDKLTPILVRAVQELHEEIQTLKMRNDTLKEALSAIVEKQGDVTQHHPELVTTPLSKAPTPSRHDKYHDNSR